MAKQRETKSQQGQPYDSALKALFEDQLREMLSFLVEGVEYQEELKEEILKPPLRADRVYLVKYLEVFHVLHVELETQWSDEIIYRLLEYFGILYRKYKKPLISVVVYPFEVKQLPESPLRITSGDKEVLVFHFRVVALWKLQARHYIEKHDVSLYALLPTMTGANYEILSRAIEEMKEYHAGQEKKLATHLLYFWTFLDRTSTVSPEDKRRIQEKMDQFDSLLEENPYVQKKSAEAEEKGRTEGKAEGIAEGKAEGIAEGKAEGIAEGLQKALVTVIEGRFPPLKVLAQERVPHITTPDTLSILLKGVVSAPDEATARWLLDTFAA